SGDELAKLGAALGEAEHAQLEHRGAVATVRLLILTGMRLGEVLGLQWRHIDRDRNCLRLDESKTGPKVVHLNAPALEVLNSIKQRADCRWVIAAGEGDTALSVWKIESAWRRIRKRASIADCRLHDLRHSFASVAAAGGLSLPII